MYDALLTKALDDSTDPWCIATSALYRLCEDHPKHRDRRAAIAKVLLIGRSHAAAIERRKKARGGAQDLGDNFYVDSVGPAFSKSRIDAHLSRIPSTSDISTVWEAALATHGYLVALIHKLTGDEKRSLASKYLHFHRPNAFFIYDSRAAGAIRKVTTRPKRQRRSLPTGCDATYAAFFLRLMELRDRVRENRGVLMTPRQVDRFFLAVAARED